MDKKIKIGIDKGSPEGDKTIVAINASRQIVGITFNPSAWQAIEQKAKKELGTECLYQGIHCYVLSKQEEECIAWFDKDMMEIYILADRSKYIDKLPNWTENLEPKK